jgi:hypothetical protein
MIFSEFGRKARSGSWLKFRFPQKLGIQLTSKTIEKHPSKGQLFLRGIKFKKIV